MNSDAIRILAKESGIENWWDVPNATEEGYWRAMAKFADLVSKAESEACLDAVRGVMLTDHAFNTWKRCVKAIQERITK